MFQIDHLATLQISCVFDLSKEMYLITKKIYQALCLENLTYTLLIEMLPDCIPTMVQKHRNRK